MLEWMFYTNTNWTTKMNMTGWKFHKMAKFQTYAKNICHPTALWSYTMYCTMFVQWWQLCFSFELILISRGNTNKDRICSAVKEIPLAQRYNRVTNSTTPGASRLRPQKLWLASRCSQPPSVSLISDWSSLDQKERRQNIRCPVYRVPGSSSSSVFTLLPSFCPRLFPLTSFPTPPQQSDR